MGWLRARLGEKSTHFGLGIMAALLASLAGPEQVQAGGQYVGLVLALVQAFRKG